MHIEPRVAERSSLAYDIRLDEPDPRPIDLRASSRGGWLWITYPTYIVHAITYNAAAVPREVTSRFVALMRRRASRCRSRKRLPARHRRRRHCQCFSSTGRVSSLRVVGIDRHFFYCDAIIVAVISLRGSFAGAPF